MKKKNLSIDNFWIITLAKISKFHTVKIFNKIALFINYIEEYNPFETQFYINRILCKTSLHKYQIICNT